MSSPTDITRPHNVPLGVVTILALSLGDALIKSLGGSGEMGLWQLFVLRSALAFPVLLIGALAFFGGARLAPKASHWIVLRSGLLVAMWIAYYLALPLLPLAVAAAAYYTLPLFIVAFAAPLGGEQVGRWQWAGVALGFVGIIFILQPGSEAFSWAVLLPIAAAILYALAMILTQTKCRNEHPATLALGLNASFILVGFIGLLVPIDGGGFLSADWVAMDARQWGMTAILAGLILVASVGTAVVYQAAPASTVGTFDFAYVGFALIWGILFFAERPSNVALFGIGLIVVAGVLAVRRT